MKKYAYWGHLMFPKMKTEDVLNRVETLGTRRQVKVFMIKHRLGETGEDSEHEEQENQKNGIIDDGASDNDDDLFKDLPEKGCKIYPNLLLENQKIFQFQKSRLKKLKILKNPTKKPLKLMKMSRKSIE